MGYTGDLYHAWINTYIPTVGWVNNMIYFDGTSWKLMDPTFASKWQIQPGNHEDYIGDDYLQPPQQIHLLTCQRSLNAW